MEGWIKLHRQLIDSPVFAHPTALKIWIWFLCKANHKERTVQLSVGDGYTAVTVRPGQLIFGRHKAEEDLGIDGSTIYKWLRKFEVDMKMISVESNNKFSIITILNFNDFQSEENDDGSSRGATEEQQRNNSVTTEEQQSNTNKNVNNVNNENNIPSVGVAPPASLPSIDDRKKDFGNALIPFVDKYGKDMIRQFFDYWTEKGEKHKKMRYEKEKVFEIEKRLATWKLKDEIFRKKPKSNSYQKGQFVQ